jgi:hypothetical protein
VIFKYGAITLYGFPFQGNFSNQTSSKCSPSKVFLCTRKASDDISLQPLTVKNVRFGLFPVRSPLLRELTLFSFPPLTEMFHFSGFTPHCKQCGNMILIILGFPIRKSTDQRLLDTSPRLIAVTPRPSSPQPPEASTIRP